MASIFRLVSLLAVYGCPSWGKLATMGVRAGGRIQQVASLTLTEKGEDPEVHMDVEQMIVSKAMVEYARRVSGQEKLYYIGHSQGTLMGFAGLSSNQTLAKMILPPRMVGGLLDALGTGELWPSGHDTTHFNISRLPVYLAHNPAGTSVRNIVHWAQCVRSDNFQMYDYGLSGNQQHYGQSTPPLYNPSEVTVPVALFTAKGDYLADPTDMIWLREQLSHVLIYEQDMPDWEHLDFIWSPDAATTIYPAIIDLMQKHRNGIPLSPLVH